MRDIDFNAAVAMMVDAAESQPEGYKYVKPSNANPDGNDMGGGCFYIHKDAEGNLTVPGCIVGTGFLNEKIMTVEDFHTGGYLCHYNGNESHTLIGVIESAEKPTARFTERARFFLRTVQTKQDNGTPWDKAVSDTLYLLSTKEFRNRYDDTFPKVRETVSE